MERASLLGLVPQLQAVERQRPVEGERPLPVRRPEGQDGRCSIARLSAVGRPPRIEVPRWVQLVGLPLVLVLAWVVATAAGHVVFLFLVAGLVALLLDPLVLALQRVRLPRGISVPLVYLTFAAAVGLVIPASATAAVGEAQS